MDRARALEIVSTVQLSCGIVGVTTAIRRGHAYQLPFLRGRRDRVVRDSVFLGTALSAPLTMMAAQALATRRVMRGESEAAPRLLGGLGAVMAAGYLAERHVRHRLRRAGFDRFETPVIVVGIATAAAMAALGARGDAG